MANAETVFESDTLCDFTHTLYHIRHCIFTLILKSFTIIAIGHFTCFSVFKFCLCKEIQLFCSAILIYLWNGFALIKYMIYLW